LSRRAAIASPRGQHLARFTLAGRRTRRSGPVYHRLQTALQFAFEPDGPFEGVSVCVGEDMTWLPETEAGISVVRGRCRFVDGLPRLVVVGVVVVVGGVVVVGAVAVVIGVIAARLAVVVPPAPLGSTVA
jgi:hypothetical protein